MAIGKINTPRKAQSLEAPRLMEMRRSMETPTAPPAKAWAKPAPLVAVSPPSEPEVSKSHGAPYKTLWQKRNVRWRVAELKGGQHGPYQLAAALPGAHGTYGKLRLGLDAGGAPVAVKVLRLLPKAKAPTLPSSLDNILVEANAAAQAGPEHRALDVLQAGDKVYLVMPLAGGDMFELLHGPDGHLSPLRAPERGQLGRHGLAQLAPALARMHGQGWAHLDLKLENVLWAADGTLRLTDFGFATNALADQKEVTGTPHMIPPEMLWQQVPLDGRADVWSLGLTLCEMMAAGGQLFTLGLSPRQAGSFDQILWRVQCNHDAFERWRDGLRQPDGDFALDQLDPDAQPDAFTEALAEHFGEVHRADPVLCQFIFKHMLAVDVWERATMREVARFAATLPEAQPELRPQLATLFDKHAPTNPQREAVLQLLHDVRDGTASPAQGEHKRREPRRR